MFSEKKATQLAAYILKNCGGEMKYIKLIKLMYLADRFAISNRGKGITEDTYYAMENGMVPSNTYNLIQLDPEMPEKTRAWVVGEQFGELWKSHIKTKNFNVKLTHDLDTTGLSQFEIEIAEFVIQNYGEMGAFDLVDLLHERLKEWKQIRSGRELVTIEEIVDKAVKKDALKEIYISDLRSIRKMDELFS